MAAMVGARRALLAARYSPRGELAAAILSPARRVDSPHSLPAERGCPRFLVPRRGAGSLASEQIDGDYHRDWGVQNAGSYGGESRSKHSPDHFSRPLQRDPHSAHSSEGIDRNKGVHADVAVNAHYGGNSEQPYQSGGSFGLPDSRQPYTSPRVNNEPRGYTARQSYGGNSAYGHQNPKGDIPSAHQQHGVTPAINGLSADGNVQRGRDVTGYDCSSGYNSRSNQESYTSEQYGYGPPILSHQSSTGSDQQVFQQQKVDRISNGSQQGHNGDFGYYTRQPDQASSAYNRPSPNGGPPSTHQQHNGIGYATHNFGYNTQSNQQNYNGRQNGYGPSGQSYQSLTGNVQQQNDYQSHDHANRPVNSASQYPNTSHFHKEHVPGFQQGHKGDFGYNASQAYQSHYTINKIDTHRIHRERFMNVNTDVQHSHNRTYPEPHSDIQPITSAENNLSSTPYQDNMYFQHSLPGSLPNDGSPSEVSNEVSGISKGTIEELDKLCEDGNIKEALEALPVLQGKGIVLHAPQYFKLMQACADASALAEARQIHNQISQSELAVDIDVNNKILDMYAKCASMEDAKKLFSTMAQHDLTSWSTIISGFVHNGLGEEATDFFDRFKQTGDKPDPGMFTHVFLACGILGSVDEGMLHFESMQKDFGITPSVDHYASIVNMLGQSGYVDEAREFIERMPTEPSVDIWESLMNMCRLNGYLELGDRCAQIIERLDPSRLNEQSKTGLFPVNASDLAKEKERKKANTAEARSKVHEYRAGDRSHPETLKIYEELRYLAAHMKEAGYIADTRFVLHDVDPETKEDALLAHSERLAVSYGLITSAARSPIRVIKNLRSCGDCHTALKIISKLVGRQIIARDAKRFHHFENGLCSCKDYW
ncbi:pentatricopeptide repeat-containing protein At4g32450, mitochondrial-like isoform X2 [Hordeum vulgare subsp. vulgare]|uniref:pentatricopeptide repeat-containing protein At4g32450, mitochondrial-like isoform X2 n=1 Tax=Hordeum vulgare subsp. vulgare TaxID=112509 RepID=UPI000B485345|nr:pentatricopeptide repeat-containing protein At4g32450, mitochondrial-like isoform X2 [Hordeum vulgare subsp. vulgare]